LLENVRHVAREFGRLVDALDEKRKRLVARTVLDLVNALDRAKIYWIGGKAVKCVGWHAQDLSLAYARSSVTYKAWFRLAAVDLQ